MTALDPEIVGRLEAEASRNPRAYRLRLVLLALAGDLALTATQVLPIAVPVVIGVVFINLQLYYWLGAVSIIVLAWLMRPTFRFEGRELRIEEAPRLYEHLADLGRRLGVPGRMRVYLDGSFNASAAETRGMFGVLGTQRALTLGIPLLSALTPGQTLAVIAHEFGHFSRRHGRFGHWLYRARAGWIRYAEDVSDSDSSFYRAAAWYAKQFVPYFSVRSFVHSRQCEYEADADAASVVGGTSFAQALTRIEVISRLWEERLPRDISTWRAQSATAPDDFYERFARTSRQCSSSDLKSWLDAALRAPSDWLDTHPSLSERLRSLQQEPALIELDSAAGAYLLGENWPTLLAEFNTTWKKEAQANWLLEHLVLTHISHPLLAADAATASKWTEDRRLARAKALRAIDPAAGLAELKELHQENTAHKHIKFAYAAALLTDNEEAGVALMEDLARGDPAFRVEGFSRVLAYFERKGDTRQIERWSAWLKRASQNLEEALSAFMKTAEVGEALGSSLPAAEKAVVSEAARLDPCVTNAWLLEGTAQLRFASDRPPRPILVHLFALAIDPKEAERHGEDEESIGERYQRSSQKLLPPDQVPVVRTYFTTEPMPAIYAQASGQTRPSIT